MAPQAHRHKHLHPSADCVEIAISLIVCETRSGDAQLESWRRQAKRVIVMVYMAAVTGKALTEEQKIGAGVAISFVLVYSVRALHSGYT